MRNPVALRGIDDRRRCPRPDGMGNVSKVPLSSSDWFNWDVVARALGIQEKKRRSQLGSFLRNYPEVEKAFLRLKWETTKDLLYKIEAEKRREFMDGRRVPAHA